MSKWEMVRLGDFCDVLNGYAFKSEHYDDKGVRVIRITNVQKGYIEDLQPQFYPVEKTDSKYALYENDLLISLTGNVGRVALLSKEFLPAALNQRVACLRNKDEYVIDRGYLFSFLNSDTFENDCISSSKGVAQKNMSTEWLKEYEIPLPPLEEQKRIANELDKISNFIEKRKTQLEKLDMLVKSRFIEMFGDPETNPFGWGQVAVNDVCSSIVRGPFGSALKKEFFVAPDESTYKVYEQKHAIQKSDLIGSYYITSDKFSELKRFECKSGDILMSCSGTMGELFQLPEGCERGIINQALCKFTLNSRILPVVFLIYMKQTIGNLETKGSGVKNIAAVSYVKSMPINLPTLNVQQQFATFVAQVDKSKFEVQKGLEKLEILKKSLMQEYFG